MWFFESKDTPFKRPFQWLIKGMKICFGDTVGNAERKVRILDLVTGW
jgi:hypothetical protein